MTTPTLRLAHIVEKTQSEGPGLRTAIWVQGCTIRCPGCCNPELFTKKGGRQTSLDEVIAACDGVEGLTVVGGEPFEQTEGLAALMQALPSSLSRLVFSGYRREELEARGCLHTDTILANIDVLVDGQYDSSKPDDSRRYIGSTNQRVHFLTDRYGPDDFRGEATMELRYKDGKLVVVGWPAWR
ncbi:MAG: 4Fe-4S single cluster domain-containing protein [Myxococcota bacterium]